MAEPAANDFAAIRAGLQRLDDDRRLSSEPASVVLGWGERAREAFASVTSASSKTQRSRRADAQRRMGIG
jgi:hypothetical protein